MLILSSYLVLLIFNFEEHPFKHNNIQINISAFLIKKNYIIELAKLFHCTADYILELDNKKVIDISKYNKNEAKLIRDLISYIDSNRK